MQMQVVQRQMPNSTSPQIPLTPQGQQLLDVLRVEGGWVNRADLAKQIGKKALNKWDLVLLSKLADANLIEVQQVPRHGPIGYEWQYRAKQLSSAEPSL